LILNNVIYADQRYVFLQNILRFSFYRSLRRFQQIIRDGFHYCIPKASWFATQIQPQQISWQRWNMSVDAYIRPISVLSSSSTTAEVVNVYTYAKAIANTKIGFEGLLLLRTRSNSSSFFSKPHMSQFLLP
jgi:hypothetical protein